MTDSSSHDHQPPGRDGSGFLHTVDRVLDWLCRLCMAAAGVGLVVLVAIFGWLVYGRYVLNNTPTWVEQVSLLLVVYITFLGAAVGVWRNTHLSIEFVRESLPLRPRLVARTIADVIVLVFACVMAWQGGQLVMNNLARPIPMLQISEGWRAAPLAVCGALMVVFAGFRLVERFAGMESDGNA